MPDDAGRTDVRGNERARLATGDRLQHKMLRGTCGEIRRRKRLAIALKFHPVENRALEALLVTLFEVAQPRRRRRRLRRIAENRRERAVGTDDASPGIAGARAAAPAAATSAGA